MPNYRRLKIAGGTHFFTVVTYDRQPCLTSSECRAILQAAWLEVCSRFPFTTIAVCLLPDHLHCIWSLPEGDKDFSLRWRQVKGLFTKRYLRQVGPGGVRNESRLKRREAAVRQRRFWEHAIRDEQDLNRHLDTIHYNPVKHGLVKRVKDWPWSSFHRYVREGYYEDGWGEGIGEDMNKMIVRE